MKIVIFGVGRFYQENKNKIPLDIEIVAFLDNNSTLQGKYENGVPIISPNDIGKLSYDKIVLMSISEDTMKAQLIKLGIERKYIWYWKRFISEIDHGNFKLYCGNRDIKKYEKKILIISTDLGYNGGTIAAIYAGTALQNKGYTVTIATPSGGRLLIEEITESGINVVIWPSLPYIHKKELFWIQQFEAVIVNVFQMVLCACEICKIKPVLWWIHECGEIYENTLKQFHEDIDFEAFSKISMYAVSHITQRSFNAYFPDKIKKILSYGIPDKKEINHSNKKTDDLVFAVIGVVCPRKAQDIFMKAVQLLHSEEKQNIQFWVIGFIGTDIYSNEIKTLASTDKSIKVTGELSRREMHELYAKIDVVVCSSVEDPLPIVVTESMMYGKTCIVSDEVGTAKYISNGENGFIFKSGDVSELCEKMRYVIQNKNTLQVIGNNARQFYEKNFTMESFGERLDAAIEDTIKISR